jgi:hypothetical protein
MDRYTSALLASHQLHGIASGQANPLLALLDGGQPLPPGPPPSLSKEDWERLRQHGRRHQPELFVSPDPASLTDSENADAVELLNRVATEQILKDCAIDEYGYNVVGVMIRCRALEPDGTPPEEHLKLTRKGYKIRAAIKNDKSAAPQREPLAESEVSAEFGEGGKLRGKLLTTDYLKSSTDWDFTPSYIAKSYGNGKLTKRQPVKNSGKRKFAYDFQELSALRMSKTQLEGERERAPLPEAEIERRATAIRRRKGQLT